MEKWASKWLDMHSQIHKEGGLTPSHTLPRPLTAFAARFKTSAFSAPPPATISLGPALRLWRHICT